MLKEEPYSQKEADAAAGTGCASFYEARELRAEQQRRDEEARKMEIEV
jgi:bud site selection protein 20